MPRVSILMGVYRPDGRTDRLEAAVRSLFAQTFRDWELLVCDDGSAPAVSLLLERFAQEDMRLRLVRPGGTHTLPEKLNACMAAATGSLLARQDDDDRSLPQRLERQVAYLDAHPDCAFVGCNVRLLTGDQVVGERRLPPAPTPWDFRFSQPFIHPTLMIRREALETAGGYSTARWAVLCEDYDLLLRLYALGYSGRNLQELLFCYRVEPDDYKKRRYRHRVNEAVTRWQRFSQLGMLPRALPYVLKPLAVGLLPQRLLAKWKEERNR